MASDYSTCANTHRGPRTQQGDLLVTGNIILNGNIVPNGAAQVSFGRVPGTVWVDTSVGLTISGGANATPNEPAGKLSIDLPTLADLLSEYLEIPESSGGSGSVSAAALAAAIAPYLDGTEAINVPADTSGGTSGGPQETGDEGEYLSFVTQSGLENYVAGQLSHLDLSGEVSIETLAPAYDAETAYEEGDVISFGGKFYARTGSGSGAGTAPDDAANGATYWTEFVFAPEILARLEAASGNTASISQGQTPGLVWVDTSVGLTISGGADATPLEPAGKLSIDLPALAGLLEQYLNGTTAVGTEPLPGGSETEDVYLSFVSQDAMESYVASQFTPSVVATTYVHGTNYAEGDVVEYNGTYYRAKQSVDAVLATQMSLYPGSMLAGAFWEEVEYTPTPPSAFENAFDNAFENAFDNAFENAFDNAFENAFDNAFERPEKFNLVKVYQKDDVVEYNGVYYKARGMTQPGTTPLEGNADWQIYEQPGRNAVGNALGVEKFELAVNYAEETLVNHNGAFYVAIGTSAVTPDLKGWERTTPWQYLLDKIAASSGTKNRAIENAVNGTITLVGNGGAVNIGFDTTTPNIVHQQTLTGGTFDLAVWGHNIVEFDVIYTNAQAASALTWNGSAVTWIRGSVSDLTAGRHLLRFRIIPQLDLNVPGAILVEYLCELPASF